jgi:hypothetical protein
MRGFQSPIVVSAGGHHRIDGLGGADRLSRLSEILREIPRQEFVNAVYRMFRDASRISRR